MPRAKHLTDAPLPRGTKKPGRKRVRAMRAHLKTVPDAARGGGRKLRQGGEEGWGCNKIGLREEAGGVGASQGNNREDR